DQAVAHAGHDAATAERTLAGIRVHRVQRGHRALRRIAQDVGVQVARLARAGQDDGYFEPRRASSDRQRYAIAEVVRIEQVHESRKVLHRLAVDGLDHIADGVATAARDL